MFVDLVYHQFLLLTKPILPHATMGINAYKIPCIFSPLQYFYNLSKHYLQYCKYKNNRLFCVKTFFQEK